MEPHRPTPLRARLAYGIILLVLAGGTFATQTGLISLPFIRGPAPGYDGPVVPARLAVRAPTTDDLEQAFGDLGYDLDSVRSEDAPVPRRFLDALPDDFAEVTTDRRKALFLGAMLPLVLRVNEHLAADRARLLEIRSAIARGATPVPDDVRWLAGRHAVYGTREGDLRSLAIRLDSVPVSLALAQAAIESGWGTSRFARDGNALFGQWTLSDEVLGLVPADRPAGATYRVRAFSDLLRATWKYALNLNTHPAYRAFRRERAALRARGEALTGRALAATLHAYSERGDAYVDEVLTIISANHLAELNRSRLADAE
jgi:Bax protein